jgi:hypothetical protein
MWLFRGIPSKPSGCYRYRQFKSLANKNPTICPHSLLILAVRFTNWRVILLPQTALTLIVSSNGRTLCSLSGAN